MTMRRRELFGGLLAASLLGSGCKRPGAAGANPRVTVSAGPYLSLSPFYLAVEEGYFAGEGLDLNVQEIAYSSQVLPLLAGGKVDVAFTAVNPALINAVAQGAYLRIVAGREEATPGCNQAGTLYGRRGAFPNGLTDMRQLKGKRVAIERKATILEFVLDDMLAQAGLSPGDLTVVVLGVPEAVAALTSGKIDAVVGNGADKELSAVTSQLVRGPSWSEVMPSYQYTHIVFGRALLEGDPAVGTRFLSAYLKGSRDYVAGRTPRFLEEHARKYGMDAGAARGACRAMYSAGGQVNIADLQRFIDWAVRRGYCPRRVNAPEVVDTRFLAKLAQTSGRK